MSLTTLDKLGDLSGIMGHNVRILVDNYHVHTILCLNMLLVD